jgi:DNA-binding transcriptional ArsR family regulator
VPDADLAAVAELVARPARARMLLALADGRALPATLLAQRAGVAASTASEHLGRLVDGGLLVVEAHGRHRYYRLAGPDVAHLLEALARVAPEVRVRSLSDATRGAALHRARWCYDHLAGRLGVAVLDVLLADGTLDGHDGSFRPGVDQLSSRVRSSPYRLGPGGPLLEALGVAPGEIGGRRPLLACCVDWSEQRHHLAGGLGAAVAEAMVGRGWIERTEASRAVRVLDAGVDGLRRVGVDADVLTAITG